MSISTIEQAKAVIAALDPALSGDALKAALVDIEGGRPASMAANWRFPA